LIYQPKSNIEEVLCRQLYVTGMLLEWSSSVTVIADMSHLGEKWLDVCLASVLFL